MPETILDASALLALLLGETGAETVARHLEQSCISAVNYSEVLARTARLCGSLEEAKRRIDRHDIPVIDFDAEQAVVVASLVSSTRHLGLSFTDRSCLALGLSKGRPVLTADRVWSSLDIGVRIECIR